MCRICFKWSLWIDYRIKLRFVNIFFSNFFSGFYFYYGFAYCCYLFVLHLFVLLSSLSLTHSHSFSQLFYSHLGFYALQFLKIDFREETKIGIWPSCCSLIVILILFLIFKTVYTHTYIQINNNWLKLIVVGLIFGRKKNYKLIGFVIVI